MWILGETWFLPVKFDTSIIQRYMTHCARIRNINTTESSVPLLISWTRIDRDSCE